MNDGAGQFPRLRRAGRTLRLRADSMAKSTDRGAASSVDATSLLLQQIEEDLRALSATVTPLTAEEKARVVPTGRKRAMGRPNKTAEMVVEPVPVRESIPVVARGLATAQAAVVAVAAAPAAALAVVGNGGKPTGGDLADPRNFGLLPERSRLVQGGDAALVFKKRVADELAFAQKVLHTSGVPAAVWREWRAYEREAGERLRALG